MHPEGFLGWKSVSTMQEIAVCVPTYFSEDGESYCPRDEAHGKHRMHPGLLTSNSGRLELDETN